jgi:oxysterol-binding protein 1
MILMPCYDYNEVDDSELGLFYDAVEKLQRHSYKKNPLSLSSKSSRSDEVDSVKGLFDENGEPFERDELPWLKDPNNKPSIWAIIKDSMGKDLSKVGVPVYFNDPTSTLQKIC